ncbi:MAG: ABC transporter permease [Pirellulales bacterium]|nr:ABC transporter permease [Pirellulales bacterium]
MPQLFTPARPWLQSPLPQIVLARIKEFIREPEAVFWVCIFPVMMVILLGIAFRSKKVDPVVVDLVTTDAASPRLAELLEKEPEQFIVKRSSAEQATIRLRTAKTDLIIRVRPQAAEHAATSESSAISTPAQSTSPLGELAVTYHFDPTQPKSLLARNSADDLLQRAAGRRDVIPHQNALMEEPGGRYIDFLVPGLLGMNIMGGGLFGVGFVLVDMRIRKLLKRFLATPMRKSQFLGGVMVARLVFLIPEVVLLIFFAWLIFDVRIYGSLWEVLVLVLLGAFTFSGIGLLIASRANTIEMVSGLMNVIMMPMWLFSGIFFSSEKYPEGLQPFIQALPLTSLNNMLRAVMQEGGTILSHPGEFANVLGWGIVSFWLALRLFRWN